MTGPAPAARSAAVQAASVAPVVTTSSTRTASDGAWLAGASAIDPAGPRIRALRPRPTCGCRSPLRTRHGAYGRPVRRASARASAAAWSMPRRRRWAGCTGTGTIEPRRIPGGACAAIWAAMTSAMPTRPPNLSARTRAPAGLSYANGAQQPAYPGEPADPGAPAYPGAPADPRSSSALHPRHSGAAAPASAPQATQSRGTSRLISFASMPRGCARVRCAFSRHCDNLATIR